MNTTSTLLAILPEADLATLTGGLHWVGIPACMQAAAVLDVVMPGLGALIRPYCTVLVS